MEEFMGAMLDALYRSLAQPDALAEFLDELCRATRSLVGSAHTLDFATGHGSLPVVSGLPLEVALDYDQRYAAQNVIMQRIAHLLMTGSLHISDDYISTAELRDTVYWREYLSLLDLDHVAVLCGTRDSAQLTIISLFRSDGAGAYYGKDKEFLKRLSPHWVNACQIRRKLGVLNDTVLSLHTAFDHVALAVVFIDLTGRVCHLNESAEQLLRRGDAITLRNRRLVARDRVDARHLDGAVIAATRSVLAIASPPRVASRLVLHNGAGIPLAFASVHPLGARISDNPGTTTPQAAVFIRALSASSENHVSEALGELFGLTPTEARLAEALHSSGDLAVAALDIGISVDTARSRLKVVFDKTDTHSQPALVKMISELKCVLG